MSYLPESYDEPVDKHQSIEVLPNGDRAFKEVPATTHPSTAAAAPQQDVVDRSRSAARHAWQARVIEEKAELDKKIKALEFFLGKDVVLTLNTCDVYLLNQQLQQMNAYSAILLLRINRFTEQT